MVSRRRFLAGVAAGAAAAQSGSLRFGVIADVQYADKDTAGRRRYRESLEKLRHAVRELSPERTAFTIHLGDLVDEGEENFDRIRPVFEQLSGKRYHVLGNHDFFGPRAEVLRKFGLERGYYSFAVKPWRFIVLDGMDVSVKSGWRDDSPNYRSGVRILEELRRDKARNAHEWNGAVGAEQRRWLAGELQAAERNREGALVFCHFPTLAAACRPDHLLWDHAEVLRMLESSPAVVAYMNGHDHNGGYAEQNGIHHVTLRGMVEHDVASSVRVCDAFLDRLVLRRAGERDGQVLPVGRRDARRADAAHATKGEK